MIKIDKGIELPPGRTTRKYPWREMEIGDSFYVSDDEFPGLYGHERFRTLVSAAGTRMGLRFSVRKVEGGLRVWRTA